MPKSRNITSLEHFSRLSQSVFIHEPSATSTQDDKAPDLILIATWMDASLRNIAKYTTGYAALYPSARILVITTSSTDAAFRSRAANAVRVTPVLEILYALPPHAKLLVHLSSNGGAFTVTFIADAYLRRTGKPLPLAGMVLDSSPGRETCEATVRAFAVGLPKNMLLRWVGAMVFRILYGMYRLVYLVSGTMDMVERARRDLNSRKLFGVGAPRLYIYSAADDMVAWEHVEEHIEEARRLGFVVDKERFVDSGHAGHLVSDEKRYWDAVVRLWSSIW